MSTSDTQALNKEADASADAVLQVAHEWRVKLDAAETTEADRQAFQAWLDADIRHEEAYDRAVTVAQALGTLGRDQYDERVLQASWRERLQSQLAKVAERFAPARVRLAAAAVVLVALGLVAVPYVAHWSGQEKATAHYVSDIAETRQVTLADGTVATLGAASEIHVEMGPAGRKVRLTSGAAHFDVAKDAARPFTVAAGDLSATALGTVFDVRRNGGVARVAVSEGAVRVSFPFVVNGEATSLRAQEDLAAGQQIAATREGLHEIAAIKTDAVGAWRYDRLDYTNAPLSELVADANRHIAGTIRIDDPRQVLASHTVTASFDGANIDRMLATLPDILPVRIDRTDPGTVVIRPSLLE